MEEHYNFESVELKWQQRWAEAGAFSARPDPSRSKYYVLEMLPYPSGALHLGHVRNYSLGDSVARFKRMQGFNVLHPIGWDAFGLPAENAAIRNKVHPERWTLDNIARMKAQCLRMGWSYDWDREIATCRPDYYRWNQWFFLKMFEAGLAYKKKGMVNWCERCQTVLANEQVVNGRCWRDDSVVVQRELEQWNLKITHYVEELLQDLDRLEDWPEKVRTMQRNWIGRSVGARVVFPLAEEEGEGIDIFTTRLDTIYGATFMVLAPEHGRVRGWMDDPTHGPELARFAEEMRRQDRAVRTAEDVEKRGVFTGRYAVNPFTREKVPIWVANFVLMEYGTGAIMAVPAHDERDFDFARKYDLPIRTVVVPPGQDPPSPLEKAYTEYGRLVNSGPFSGLTSEEAQEKMAEYAGSRGLGEKSVSYRLKDWGISRQRYWGTPIPIVYCSGCGTVPVPEEDLPVVLPRIEEIRLGGSPLETVPEFVNTSCPRCKGPARRETDTMDTFVDSSWYFYRYTDPRLEAGPFRSDVVRYWFPVDIYIGGVEHAVLHLIYMRFFTKVMRDLGLVDFGEPVRVLFTQGMVIKDGAKMSKSRGNAVEPDDIIRQFGADALRLFIQFCAPPEGDLDWNDQGMEGCSRFLNRVWRLHRRFEGRFGAVPGASAGDSSEADRALRRELHQTIRKVTEDLERFRQNTAIAAVMKLLNTAYDCSERDDLHPDALREALEGIAILLSPFVPHFAEELWEKLGYAESIQQTPWPRWDPELAREESLEIVVQINGKVRSRFFAPPEVTEGEMQSLALEDARVRPHLEGKAVRKVIVIPRKLVNIVVGAR